MNPELEKRVSDCHRLFLLAEVVDLQRVQCVSRLDEKGFKVTLVSGVVVFGLPDLYEDFMKKYIYYLSNQ